MSWCLHAVLLSVILRTMSLPASIPWVEVFAYTGYVYVPACLIITAGIIGGECREGRAQRWGWARGGRSCITEGECLEA